MLDYELIKKIDELNDLAEGVIAVPMPKHLDRDEVIRKTSEAISEILNVSK